jgi:hypothetical protein
MVTTIKNFGFLLFGDRVYASGLSIGGELGKMHYAFEVKNAALASRPESWDLTRNSFSYPTFSGRVGFKPNVMWDFGISGSIGSYLHPEAAFSLRGETVLEIIMRF